MTDPTATEPIDRRSGRGATAEPRPTDEHGHASLPEESHAPLPDPVTDQTPERFAVPVDGRRARRSKNRAAVVDATLDLLVSGEAAPTAEAIAAAAGVSVSSVFRYFESIEDLKVETINRYFERYAPLFEIPDIGAGSLDERIERLVDARIALYDQTAPIGRLARARGYDQPRFAQSIAQVRARFLDQVDAHFEAELTARSDADADDLASVIDALCSFESWELQRVGHARSADAIRRSWISALNTLLRDSARPH